MKERIFVKLSQAIALCQDVNGKQIALPLLGKMKVIDDEVYCYIEGFLDQYCNPVDEHTTKILVEKFSTSFN